MSGVMVPDDEVWSTSLMLKLAMSPSSGQLVQFGNLQGAKSRVRYELLAPRAGLRRVSRQPTLLHIPILHADRPHFFVFLDRSSRVGETSPLRQPPGVPIGGPPGAWNPCQKAGTEPACNGFRNSPPNRELPQTGSASRNQPQVLEKSRAWGRWRFPFLASASLVAFHSA